jgi:thymidine phosphorylase
MFNKVVTALAITLFYIVAFPYEYEYLRHVTIGQVFDQQALGVGFRGIDHAVGLEFHKRIGDPIKAGETLVTIHYNGDAKLAEARTIISGSFRIGATQPPPRPLVRRLVGA